MINTNLWCIIIRADSLSLFVYHVKMEMSIKRKIIIKNYADRKSLGKSVIYLFIYYFPLKYIFINRLYGDDKFK